MGIFHIDGLKDLWKQFGKNNKGYENAEVNKQWWYQFYLEFFIRLTTSYFTWKNLPDSVDPLFLEKALVMKGYIAFFNNEDVGFVCARGAMGNRLDYYDHPTTFDPVTNASAIRFPRVGINWYRENLDPNKAVIVGNNNTYSSTVGWLRGFCWKLAEIEQTIQLNRNAQIRPFVVLTEKSLSLTMKNVFNKLMQQEPVVWLEAQKNKQGQLDPIQLQDRATVLNTQAPFILDKLHDEKQRVINQVLTGLGINNNAVDKAERLVKAEATANNGLINGCIEVMLKPRQSAVEFINEIWGPDSKWAVGGSYTKNIEVMPSPQISTYNTEMINESLRDVTVSSEDNVQAGEVL